MKKWLFSNDGEITGPLRLSAAEDFIANNPNAYAWHPSYSHWVPVNCIEDFNVKPDIPAPPVEIPKELIEDFVSKERDMVSTLDRVENTLVSASTSIEKLEKDIEKYIGRTKNLNEEVKETVRNIERQYAALQKNLAGFAKNDFSDET